MRFNFPTVSPAVFPLIVMLVSLCNLTWAANWDEQAISLDTASGQIKGTLVLSHASSPAPVLLIIAGSGPTDRNGNSAMLKGPNDSLKMLAQALAEAGYSSVRYDKRGIGESREAGLLEYALRIDTYVDDAVGWIALLKKDARFNKVGVIGHSEGSMIGLRAARLGLADTVISLSGPSQTLADTLRIQLRSKLPPSLFDDSQRILAALEHGEIVENVPPPLLALYRPSVQPYLISAFKLVPTQELARLKVPVLLVQGDMDIQIAIADAQALKQAHPAAELVIVPGMNHVLKKVDTIDPARQFASYSDPTLPLAPGLMEAVSRFLEMRLK